MNKYLFSLCLILSFVACNQETENNVPVDAITFFPNNRSEVFIEDIADTSFFKVLSTDNESFLSTINRVYFSDSLMIIPQEIEGLIYFYDLDGNVVGRIDAVGRSAGKASGITDVWYNREAKLIDIFDSSLSKFFTYDLGGNLVNEVKVQDPVNAGSRFISEGNTIVFERIMANGESDTRLGVYNKNLEFQRSELPMPEKLKNVNYGRTHVLETYKDSIYYLPFLEGKIYLLGPDEISTAYEFDIPKSKLAPADYLNGTAFADFRDYYHTIQSTDYTYNFDRLHMTDKYISFNYQKGGGVGRNNVFFSRESKNIVQFSNLKSKELPGMELLSVVRGIMDDYFVITVHSTQNRYLPADIQDKLDDNSNTVLMFFKLKEF